MRKNIKITFVSVVSAFMMMSCGSKIADDAVNQGKLAMASFEYEKALASFELAIKEGSKDKEISSLVTIINGYLEAKQAFEEKEYEKVLSCIESLPSEYENQSIKKDITTLKEEAETEIKKAEEEKQAQEKAAKEKAEQEEKEKQEKEIIEKLKAQIYAVTGDDRSDVSYNLQEQGYMTDDMVQDYYCFSVSYGSGDECYSADHNVIANKSTLELFYYDLYYGKIPLADFYTKSEQEYTMQVTSETEAETLAADYMKTRVDTEFDVIGWYDEDRGVYLVEILVETRPYGMCAVNPYTGEVTQEY